MRKLIFLYTMLFCASYLFAQTEEDLVKKIRSKFNSINSNLNNYKLIVKDIEGESTEGGTMKAYFDNDNLVLLHCEFYGESGNVKEDYYYDNGDLFFMFSVDQRYTSHIMDENNKIASTTENRYYFDKLKMIRWLDKDKKTVSKTSNEFKGAASQILKESGRLIDVFNNN
jgi:hypothetical protein